MPLSTIHGFPRIGARRELKFATEAYWAGSASAEELAETAQGLRTQSWRLLQEAGIHLIPSNDFSLYDQTLDTAALVGAVPARYEHPGGDVDLDTYFAMARGRQAGGVDVTAMEMTKWFDTNYHYIVPELGPDTVFSLSSSKPFDEFDEAKALGIDVLVTVGEEATAYLEGFAGETYAAATPEEAGALLEEIAQPGDRVLVKGSRSVGLERVLA